MSLDAARLARSIGAGRPSSDYDLNADVALPPGRKLRPAAVLVAIDESGPVPQVILTKRASHLKHHPGQIAFPGGKLDADDADAAACALREAREEIGLPGAEVLGSLAPHETVTGYSVTPVLAGSETVSTRAPSRAKWPRSSRSRSVSSWHRAISASSGGAGAGTGGDTM